MSSVWNHWQLFPCAAAVGLALGLVVIAMIYLGPSVRMRLAPGPRGRALVVVEERSRLRRLGAAVLEEHGRPGAGELRDEIELRGRVLRALERFSGYRPSW